MTPLDGELLYLPFLFFSSMAEVAAVETVCETLSLKRSFILVLGFMAVLDAWYVCLAKSMLGYNSCLSSCSAALNLESLENLEAFSPASCVLSILAYTCSMRFRFFSVSRAVPLGGAKLLAFFAVGGLDFCFV